MYRPVLVGLAMAALLISALAATSYPAHAASSAHAAIGSNTPVPAAPSNLTAKAIGTTSVRLTWTNNAANQSGVVISRDGCRVGRLPRGHGQLLHLERAVTGHGVLVLRRVEDLWHAGRPDRLWQHAVRMGRPGLRDHSRHAAVDITCAAAVDGGSWGAVRWGSGLRSLGVV